MSGKFYWIKSYPLTTLMIISCLAGTPIYGARTIYEQKEAYNNMIVCGDVLGQFAADDYKVQTFLKPSKQNTMEDLKAAQEEEKKKGPFTEVEDSYFDDAVFIGDSRTDTLKLYSGWDKPTYYVKTGTNIWAIMDDEVAEDPDTGKLISIDAALSKKSFAKVYIMLGVNELGTGTPETYYQQFKKVVTRIRELQPQSIIFVESIIHVSQAKDAEGTVINNKEIDARNQWLQKLADNQTIFFIDANEVLDDDTGALISEYTFDGVHLKADHVEPWKDFLRQHGVVQKK